MQKDDCRRFEEALMAELPPAEELRRHAERCAACRALLETARLDIAPASSAEDHFTEELRKQVAQIAQRRARRWQRRRRMIPLLVGLFGYLSALIMLMVEIPATEVAPAALPQFSLPLAFSAPLPAGSPTLLAIILFCSLLWIGIVALLTRGRRAWSGSA